MVNVLMLENTLNEHLLPGARAELQPPDTSPQELQLHRMCVQDAVMGRRNAIVAMDIWTCDPATWRSEVTV
ncbi:hypothetical protein EYF80_048272 [Liparis tanakae]|uniref:Uncharacterized protein n=1 Tax=Liparis tanakae TaxID=230148 RepID=A0A4Z2FK93_9TELE|nr:hypothetical protein EYF80_048272 [Liparis tanakae]